MCNIHTLEPYWLCYTTIIYNIIFSNFSKTITYTHRLRFVCRHIVKNVMHIFQAIYSNTIHIGYRKMLTEPTFQRHHKFM